LETDIFPADVKERARAYLKDGSTGAYSDSRGRLQIRKAVARYICKRDGFDPDSEYANPEDIFLSDGASHAIKLVLSMIIRNSTCGVLIPCPQYPLYSASVPMLGGTTSSYYLNESKGWKLEINELKRAIQSTRNVGVDPRGLVILNPGNPTGQCLSLDNIQEIIDLAYREGMVILADEVYQSNIYSDKPFYSFKSALHKMGEEYKDMELFSFHSTSKGLEGECGKRGGYVEFQGICQSVNELYYKCQSVNLCPNVTGQIALGCIVDPPKPGEPSHKLWHKERTDIYESLRRRAKIVEQSLNKLEGVSCQPVEGAMYAFPQITLTKSAIRAARALGQQPDTFYCLELLEKTGLVCVPGSGFGQEDGTYHFRITILPAEDDLHRVLDDLAVFHNGFLTKYKDEPIKGSVHH
jgi:aspartate/methionine/tyrosine aminotransferase